ncbi:MAG: hypothetical protein R3F14_16275 [Polyangiaceae bacterium]
MGSFSGAGIGLAAGALSLAGCDDGGPTGSATTGETTTSTTATAACGPAERQLEDGRCQPPGLPLDMPCAPGDTPLEDGTCQAPGVPPDACGDRFETDGDGGCKPILPAKSCADGLMAVPGEVACREWPVRTGHMGGHPGRGEHRVRRQRVCRRRRRRLAGQAVDHRPGGHRRGGARAIVAVAAGVYTGGSGDRRAARPRVGALPVDGERRGHRRDDSGRHGERLRRVDPRREHHRAGIGVRADGETEILLEQARFHDTGGAAYSGGGGRRRR